MLDHLSWYLVELEQKLRGKRSGEATANLLVEAKAHIEEHASELAAKGIDREAAIKSAIADFGSPEMVSRAYAGARPMSSRAFRLWIGAIASASLFVLPWLVASPGDVMGFGDPLRQTDFLYIPAAMVAATALLAWRTRRWVAPQVATLTILAALGMVTYFGANTIRVRMNGSERLAYSPRIEQEAKSREAWLKAYEREKLLVGQIVRAPAGAHVLEQTLKEQRRGWLAPLRVSSYIYTPNLSLIGGKELRGPLWTTDPFRKSEVYHLLETSTLQDAEKSWAANGLAYQKFLAEVAEEVRSELAAFREPIPSSMAERWRELAVVPMACTITVSLFAILLNGLVLAFGDGVDRWRRFAWRRQLG